MSKLGIAFEGVDVCVVQVHRRRGAQQCVEMFVDVFEGDMKLVEFFERFGIYCDRLRNFSVNVSSFAMYGLMCSSV